MKRRYFFGITLLLLLIGSIYLYTEYHRQQTDSKTGRPSFYVQATNWLHEFEVDEKAASRKYAGQEIFVQVSGEMKNIEVLDSSHITVLMGDPGNSSSVKCLMDSLYIGEVAGLQKGSSVTIKGHFTGYKADDLGIGADIEMNFCVVVKK